MKILLLGCQGQVGWELQRSLAPLGEVLALGRHAAQNPQGLHGDLADPEALVRTVQAVGPQVIVNAAAYTAVDKAESETALAHTVNAAAPAALAHAATQLGAWLVHYSTDYVFNGQGEQAWRETDATGPLSVYGASKLAGEEAVRSTPRHLVLRTSWVYAARGGNFAKTMLRLARERDALQVVSDQFGAPTGADLLADVTAHCLRQLLGPTAAQGDDPARLAGVYHCAPAGETSWHGYACHVLQQAQRLGCALKAGPEQVRPIGTADFPTPARRPHNSRLDTSLLRIRFGLHLPHWQAGVNRMLEEVLAA